MDTTHIGPGDGAKGFMKFIAYLQVIGIVFVVIGHSFHEYPDGEMGKSLLLYRMMHSFRMPLFMFVSGFLMVFTTFSRDAVPAPSSFVRNKLKRLILPFIALTFVTFTPRVAMSHFADDPMRFNIESFWRAFVYADNLVIPYFWFIQSSFILLVVCYAFYWLAVKSHIGLPSAMMVSVALFGALPFMSVELTTFFSIDMAVKLGFFFCLGSLYAHYAPFVDRLMPWSAPWVLVCLSGAWAGVFFLTEGTQYMPLCSLLGIAMSVSCAKFLEERRIFFLDHLIGANYLIFLLSWYFNVFTQQVLSHFVNFPWWVHTLLSIIAGIYVPLLGYRYLRSHRNSRWCRFTALILGQKFR